ncbi:MAG: BON domain-containing protein [Candidatus Acidiferrales bacterium]
MNISRVLIAAVVILLLGQAAPATPQQKNPPQRGSASYNAWLTREVRHQLLLVPWYSVFDNLEYSVNGYTVTLKGQVVRPSLKSDAVAAVKNIEGVEKVDDQIEVLPASSMDDQIRIAEFHAIYGAPQLERYAEGSIQAIHIVVKNGHVTLEGVVANESDKNVANIRANTVANVFSVTNNLQVEQSH